MTVSARVTRAATDKWHNNIHKRGKVVKDKAEKKAPFSVGPVLLGFFLFVVVGSSLLQFIRAAQQGLPPM